MGRRIYEDVRRAARLHPERVAVADPACCMTYAELVSRADALRPMMSRALERPGRYVVVMIALPSGPFFTAAELAAFAEGAIVVPVPGECKAAEAENYLDLIEPDVVFVDSPRVSQALLGRLRRPARVIALRDHDVESPLPIREWSGQDPVEPSFHRLPAGTSMIQFTSGSTGRPKGVLIGAESLEANQVHSRAFCDALGPCAIFSPMPQHHAMGGAVVFEHLASGASMHLVHRFMPGTDLPRIRKTACSVIVANPGYLRMLTGFGLLKPGGLPGVKHVVLGSAQVERSLVESIQARLAGAQVHVRYGLSESVGALTQLSLRPGELPVVDGSIGVPLRGVELAPGLPAIADAEPGELKFRSGATALGQLVEPDRWEPLGDPEGWLATGDLGYHADDGGLVVTGRMSLFIKRNGYRINPLEIEGVIRGVRGVRDVGVAGVPDRLAGESIVAVVQFEPGAEVPASTILEHCRTQLSAHKVPQAILPLDLPLTASGKLDRSALQQRARQS